LTQTLNVVRMTHLKQITLLLAIPILACLFDNTCQLFSKENNIEALMGKKVKLIVAYFKGV
jgi:hypothetical protein